MAALSSKRKRDALEMQTARAAPTAMNTGGHDFDTSYLHTDDDGMDNTDAGMDFAAVLAQHNADNNDTADQQQNDMQHQQQMQQQQGTGQNASDTAAAAMAQYHTMTVPQSTEQSFMAQNTGVAGDGQASAGEGGSGGQQRTSSFDEFDVDNTSPAQTSPNGDTSPTSAPTSANPLGPPKPTVGSEEWHKVRRDNHKEVERRRRETINEGINELAKIVPGCEKNKGSILARGVQFITQLKDNETQNIEKWTLEKLLTEQAIAELSSSCDKLKAECQRAWVECEQWKKAAQKAGVSVDDDAKGDADADDAD